VAARTLRKRLETVWSELRAACRQRHDAQRVHQLRVATRRTLAALMAFREFMPGKQRAWFEKRLRRIRHAAGTTRDLDVLTGELARPPVAGRKKDARVLGARARGRLVAMLAKRRDLSREPIRHIREALVAKDWPGRVERLIDAVSMEESTEPFAAYARRRFPLLLDRFFEHADRKLVAADEIHQLRIAGKKLRYALEIFAVAFPSATRTACLDSLETLQETLGKFTDHAAAADRFRRWAREEGVGADKKTLTALRRFEDHRAEKARRVFVTWWTLSRRRDLRRSLEQTLRRDSA
jgi:CHAD domain-containing protein